MDKIKHVIDRTLAGLTKKTNELAEQGYAPEGSFNRTKDGRWFFQTMVLVPAKHVGIPNKPAEVPADQKQKPAPKEAKPKAAKATKKAKA